MKKIILASLVAAFVAAPAFAENTINAESISVEGNVITVGQVTAAANGFLVIHAVVNGEVVAPESIAHVAVVAGENTDLVVELADAPAAGTEFVAMLHEDTGVVGTYEFTTGVTDVDVPVVVDGAPVVVKFAAK